MTLYEVLEKLNYIQRQVTSSQFETNILSITHCIEGDFNNWYINFHTKDEERITEESEQLAYNCEKRVKQLIIEKACDWLNKNLSRCIECYYDDVVTTRLKEDVLEDFKKAMEE